MRLVRFFIFGLLLTAFPALAQEDLAVFRVTDVSVDVSAGNAAQARDLAILQAQGQAFDQLVSRLGAEGHGLKASPDAIAGMVKAFEVQKEHAVSQRYIGTFTVQFKPEAVREFLSGKGVAYTEARARPVVVMPVLRSDGHDTLWEDRTPWRTAWEETAKDVGLVPVIIPPGDLDDIAKISVAEAIAGKPEALQAMMQKYDAGGAVVAVLQMDLENPDDQKEGVIAILRYDLGGKAYEPSKIAIPPIPSAKMMPTILSGGVKQVLKLMESGWRQAVTPVAGPTSRLGVDVSVPTLAAWAQIRAKLAQIPIISSTHVVSMTRGMVHIEMDYRGDISTLQLALTQAGLTLEQIGIGGWTLR